MQNREEHYYAPLSPDELCLHAVVALTAPNTPGEGGPESWEDHQLPSHTGPLGAHTGADQPQRRPVTGAGLKERHRSVRTRPMPGHWEPMPEQTSHSGGRSPGQG